MDLLFEDKHMECAVSDPSADCVERRSLGFQECVGSAFTFLEEYGFVPYEASDFAVRYASHCARLVIRHDRLSYELSLGLARLGNAEELAHPYGIELLMHSVDLGLARRYRDFAATSLEGVRRGVVQLAADLKAYGEAALRCDPETFTALARARTVETDRMEAESLRVRDDTIARAAFERGDWARVIEVYEARGDDLAPSERKRLHIARRRMIAG
jgi:hypothetical protein